MPSSDLPPIGAVPSLLAEERAALLDLLFEPSTQLHTLCLELMRENTFDGYGALVDSIGRLLTRLAESPSTSDTTWLEAILGAHPRLGEKKVDSEQSRAEQAQLNTGESEEAGKLAGLNVEYECKFPGLRYVVFVNGRSRPAIMEDMKHRISSGTIESERLEAIKAMCEIASNRAEKLQSTA